MGQQPAVDARGGARDGVPNVEPILAELRAHLLAQEAGRIVLSWHWPKRSVRYELTATFEAAPAPGPRRDSARGDA